MRILHIGDFHYKSKHTNFEQSLMIDKMVASLKRKEQIDFIFFSGDLVHNGTNRDDFSSAYKSLLEKLGRELNISPTNIIMCAGNHDIDRSQCSKGTILYFNEIDKNSELDNEVIKQSNDFQISLRPLLNYNEFTRDLSHYHADQVRELYSTHVREINGKKIGILTLNSAWLSSGDKDINNLMFPAVLIKEVVAKFKNNNINNRILIVHHPFSWFKEFNAIELEDVIHKEFMLMFSGHIHREQIQTKFMGNNGIYLNTTQATLTFDRSGEIGYSIVEANLEDCYSEDCDYNQIIKLFRANYNRKESQFIDLETIEVPIPCGAEKANQNKLRKKITSKFRSELSNANQLLLDYDQDSKLDFLDLFTSPVMSTKTATETSTSESKGMFNYEDMYLSNENFLVFGKDKAGKTSLLKKLQLYYLKNYSIVGIVPLYLDYKELEVKNSTVDIKNILCTTYGINNNDANHIITKGNLILLIDNLETSSNVNDYVIEFLDEHRNVRFVVCSDYLTSRVYFEELDHLAYTKLYLNDLTRNEIRLYTEKQKNIKEYNKEEVLDRIATVCKQLQMPINYWTVSLILLIYKKSNEDYNKNLFGILDMCVDEILQKKQLLISKSKLNFEQYKEICSQIAYFLLTSHKDEVYSASYIELLTFIDSLIAKSPRLVADSKSIFDYLFATGLLKEKSNRYTFRLNGVFEYFLAYYLSHHKEFKDEILKDDRVYLVFKNELEIYSGFKRDDELFVRDIFSKTKTRFDELLREYLKDTTIDNVLNSKYDESREFADMIKNMKIATPIKHEIADVIKDHQDPLVTQSEVHIKQLANTEKVTPEMLETYLVILSRVFKNSDNISDTDLIYEIFDYLLNAYCVFGFFLIDQVSDQAKKQNLEQEEILDDFVIGEELLKLVTKFIPVLSQVMFYDGLGHSSITKIIENRIQLYKKDSANNQYKLFMLYFILMDLDVKANKDLIEDVFETVKLNPLKVSTFFKLNMYLAFKAYKNKELEEYLKRKIKEAQLRMDNKIDSSSFNKFLSKKQKRNIIQRGKER